MIGVRNSALPRLRDPVAAVPLVDLWRRRRHRSPRRTWRHRPRALRSRSVINAGVVVGSCRWWGVAAAPPDPATAASSSGDPACGLRYPDADSYSRIPGVRRCQPRERLPPRSRSSSPAALLYRLMPSRRWPRRRRYLARGPPPATSPPARRASRLRDACRSTTALGAVAQTTALRRRHAGGERQHTVNGRLPRHGGRRRRFSSGTCGAPTVARSNRRRCRRALAAFLPRRPAGAARRRPWPVPIIDGDDAPRQARSLPTGTAPASSTEQRIRAGSRISGAQHLRESGSRRSSRTPVAASLRDPRSSWRRDVLRSAGRAPGRCSTLMTLGRVTYPRLSSAASWNGSCCWRARGGRPCSGGARLLRPGAMERAAVHPMSYRKFAI